MMFSKISLYLLLFILPLMLITTIKGVLSIYIYNRKRKKTKSKQKRGKRGLFYFFPSMV